MGEFQEIASPSVYLDHWALREISESDGLSHRFATILKKRGGTLVLSWLNVVEFSKVSDREQRHKADLLVNDLNPNLFWLNPDFFTVAKQEELGGLNSLHSDSAFAQEFAMNLRGELFKAVYANPQTRIQYDNFADIVIHQIEQLRNDFDRSNAMQKAIKTLPRIPKHTRATHLIARELIATFLKDKSVKLNRNNAIDLCHAVVSLSYCDYVILDGHWAKKAEDLRGRLSREEILIPIAQVFTKRRNGLDSFLKQLETSRHDLV